MGGLRAMKASLRKVKSETRVHGHFGLVFFFLHAYTTSDLRTFRRTCVYVRKECSLEISVLLLVPSLLPACLLLLHRALLQPSCFHHHSPLALQLCHQFSRHVLFSSPSHKTSLSPMYSVWWKKQTKKKTVVWAIFCNVLFSLNSFAWKNSNSLETTARKCNAQGNRESVLENMFSNLVTTMSLADNSVLTFSRLSGFCPSPLSLSLSLSLSLYLSIDRSIDRFLSQYCLCFADSLFPLAFP